MADNTIDTLDIQVSSNTNKAARSLEQLSKKLSGLNNSLKQVNTGGLRNYAKEIGRVASAAKALNGLRVNVPNITGLSTQLKNLSGIDSGKLSAASQAIKDIGTGLSGLKGLETISFPKLDKKNINSVVDAAQKFEKVDASKISDSVNGVTRIAHAVSVLNSADFNDSKVISSINAIRRLLDTDVGKFNTGKLEEVATSLSKFSTLPDVSSGVNRFLSSLQKLVNAGEKVSAVSGALPNLTTELKKTVNTMAKTKNVSDSTNLFVQSIGRLASAGDKTGKTASQLGDLAKETKKFFEAMQDAPKISENTIRMTQALAQLASAGGKVNTATNTITKSFNKLSSATNKMTSLVVGAGSKIKSGIAGIVSAFHNLGNSSSGINKTTFSLGNLIKAAAGLQVVRKLVDFGKSAVTLGSDITEVENVVDVAFGSMADKAYEFASTATEKFGLSELAAKNYSGTMMAMLKSSGVAQKSAAEMSTTLAGLAGDLASFFNIDTDTAFYKLRSGISGEIEPLKQLGINLSVANLQAYALSQGITTSYNSMSQAEKVLLRYNYILSVTGDAQNDFSRTSGTWANQVRLLTLNLQSLAAVLGQGIIAGILPAIQSLNAFMSKLMQAANAFRNFMYVLMGKKIKGSTSGVVNDLAGLEDTSADLSGLQNAGDDASSGLDNATDSAKKLKKALSVLPFDELNQLTDNSDNAGTTSSKKGSSGLGNLAGGLAGLQDSIDDALNTEETPINKWATKIRNAFLKHDWEGLGKTIADMLNIGMQKIYDVINWKKVGPKITQFTDAFTRTFNSLVDNINWDLMGRTVGAGITTLAKTFNLLTDPSTGINFEGIGKGLSMGLRGIFNEVPWSEFGNALGNGFMISWRLLDGFVQDMSRKNDAGITGWQELGTSVAETMNGIFKKVDFSKIASTLTTGINGAFEALAQFTKKFEWNDFTKNLGDGISKFIADMNWKENGKALGDFLSHLCDALTDTLTPNTFRKLGEGIGDFIGQLPWGKLLATAAKLLISGFGEAMSELWESGLAGKITAGLTTAFVAVKVADITGIGTLVGKLIGFIGDRIMAKESTELIADKLSSILGQGTSEATQVLDGLGEAAGTSSGKFASLAKELGPLVGTAGLIVGVGAAAVYATSKIAGMVESMQGGNGVGTTFGNTMDNFIQTLQQRGDIISGSATEIWNLKESLEKEGMTAEEQSAAAQKIIDKLGEMGVTSDQAEQAFSSLYQQGLITDDMFDILSESIKTLSDKSTNMAGSLNLSKYSVDDLAEVLPKLTTQLGLNSDQQTQLNTALYDMPNASETAQGAYENIMSTAEKMGLNTETVAKIFSETFPDAIKKMDTSTTTHVGNAAKTVSDAAKTVGNSADQMKKDAESGFSGVQSAAETASSGVSTATTTNWGSSSEEVRRNVRQMKIDVSEGLGDVDKTVSSHFESQRNIITSKWEKAADHITGRGQIIDTLDSTLSRKVPSMSKYFDQLSRNISKSLSGLHSVGANAATSLYNGMKSVRMPTLSYYISQWKTHSLGNGGTSSTPVYSPNWYAKGGLFNSASVIGVGEAGQEAVLPLENRKAMKSIADSIMSGYDGSMGLTKDEIMEAVERGVVTALMNNGGFGGSSPEYIMNSIKVNERELARIVTKAQNNTDYRMNPSPAY